MKQLMKAISFTQAAGVEIKEVPVPEQAASGHLIIKMKACGINPGDKAFMAGVFAPGSAPVSQYNICGVSGVGTVTEIGPGVPQEYRGRNVAIYRSLQFSDHLVGTWSSYAQMHYLQCVILPEDVDIEDYSGSLVNVITPYAFLKQIMAEGHKGIICSAGTSATGIAMLGFCLAYQFPLISLVRDDTGRKELEELGAKNILVQNSEDFRQQLEPMAADLSATAVFDGVGGELINRMVDVLPRTSTIYSYGYLGEAVPFSIPGRVLMAKDITLKSFGNFKSKTVQDQQQLLQALADISAIIHMPHFKTKIGKKFKLEDIKSALQFVADRGGKAVLYP